MHKILIALFLILLGCVSNQQMIIVGKAKVIDGDTLLVNSIKIRLAHIDAPELKQTCLNKKTKRLIKCGENSKAALMSLIEGKNITCKKNGTDLYRRTIAECSFDIVNINQYLIKHGWAVVYKSDRKYLAEQEYAKKLKKGIWKTEFQDPSLFRKQK